MARLFYIAAYSIPAALVWGILGWLLRPLGAFPVAIVFAALVYAFGYGLVELLGLPFRAPASKWQVPASWLSGRSTAAQTLIWGSTLGPGLITRNPYAGMWLLLFLVALDQHILTAVLVGAAHGLARAVGTLSNLKSQDTTCSAIAAMGEQIRWRYRDGLALLLIAGILSAYLMWMVSP